MKSKSTLWITMTAVFIALLIAVQAGTGFLGQFVTGSLVNLILIVSVMTCGLSSGITVAVISPVFAKLLNIGPAFWTLVPFILIGNIVLVLIWSAVGGINVKNEHIARITALVTAAVCKFAVLYIGVVKIAIPLFMHLNGKQAAAISTMFSFPQLITALIGGILAAIILPLLKKVIRK